MIHNGNYDQNECDLCCDCFVVVRLVTTRELEEMLEPHERHNEGNGQALWKHVYSTLTETPHSDRERIYIEARIEITESLTTPLCAFEQFMNSVCFRKAMWMA